jgi:general secretion pathway protein G
MDDELHSQRGGFSWVEVAAILGIVVIIGFVAHPRWTVSSDAAKAKADNLNRATLTAAVERWYVEKGTWPAENLADIAADADFLPHGIPANPVSKDAIYHLNPTSHRVE